MPPTLDEDTLRRAYEMLKGNGSRPVTFGGSGPMEPMRGDPEALAVLLDDLAYHEAQVAALASERAFGRPFFVTQANEPWTLSPMEPPEKRKGPKDSTHVPFYKSLPKFKRRRR